MEMQLTEREFSGEFGNGNSEFDSSNEGRGSIENTQGSLRDIHKIGVVIPAVEDRLNNLRLVLAYLADQDYPIETTVIVADGFQLNTDDIDLALNPLIVSTQKHEPGREQPRNIGVRFLSDECTHVWFCDSDIIMADYALGELAKSIDANPDGLTYGPYDWMPPGQRGIMWDLENDPRWEMFRTYNYDEVHLNSLGVALGCFSGNLVWNIEQFKRVGGFWNDLHAGRCEDGELGIRACAMNVPMSINKRARGWHVHHEVNSTLIHVKNARDVPMINERHPYIEQEGIIVVDEDGKRFNQICDQCGESINTLDYWKHVESHNE